MDYERLLEQEAEASYLLYKEISELKSEIKELERFKRGCLEELRDVENELAPALGYEWVDGYDWVTGDHTAVTLAMEARAYIRDLEDREREPGTI